MPTFVGLISPIIPKQVKTDERLNRQACAYYVSQAKSAKMRKLYAILIALLWVLSGISLSGQEKSTYNPHIEKRYNLFFRINSPVIDKDFKDNARTIETMREDIETTLQLDGAVPDSLLILSTASPDGGYEFNRRLAKNRAASTEKLLLEMFPQFKDAHIKVEFLEEDWDGLLQVLKAHPEFPQREEMMAVVTDNKDVQSKEYRLRSLKQGWRYLVNNYIYALRNSSITLTVVMTPTNIDDEFVRGEPQVPIQPVNYSYQPTFEQPVNGDILPVSPTPPKFRKTVISARTNLLIPGLNFGIEIPIGQHWSVAIDYFYPWAVSKENKWCGEMLGWFIDGRYWFANKKNKWDVDSKLKGHAVGIYGGVGYYDYQKITNGVQGEYFDVGVDYTYALPVANDNLRLEFNIGVGFIRTLYRPYYPSSDFEDLIKEPGVKHRATNFIGPTRASVSLVYPITTGCKKNPYIPIAKRLARKEARQNKTKGGEL